LRWLMGAVGGIRCLAPRRGGHIIREPVSPRGLTSVYLRAGCTAKQSERDHDPQQPAGKHVDRHAFGIVRSGRQSRERVMSKRRPMFPKKKDAQFLLTAC